MEELLQVGIISSTHGIRGEVKVFPTTDDVNRFKQLKKVYLETGAVHKPLEIQQVKFFKQFAILKFKEFDDINQIEGFKGRGLFVPREDAVPLKQDEYYIADMIGLKVFTEDEKEFGTLKDVMETGANDVYVVASHEHGEVLIPAIKSCIIEVDVKAGRMTVRLMKGLI